MDLSTHLRPLREELLAAAGKVIDSGSFVLGEAVASFEQEFARRTGVAHGIAVNSGTSALHLALLAAGVEPGDEVITVPFTFVATVAAVLQVGGRPVLVDVDPATYTLDVRQLETAISPRTRAILPVHLYGRPAEMAPILDLARRYDLTVIEDAAQAHGARYRGRPVGGLGDIGCFSFYPTKNLGALGEGGLVVTDRAELADRVRLLRDWGQGQAGLHLARGSNYRMDALQGAFLGVQLPFLDDWTDARRRNAALYEELLHGSGAALPSTDGDLRHVFHQYVVRVADRDAIRRSMLAEGIETGVHYPRPIHLQPAFRDLGYGESSFPISERLAGEVLSLPVYPELEAEQVRRVAMTLRRLLGAHT